MLTGAELYGLNDQFVGQAGLGQKLTVSTGGTRTSEAATGAGASAEPAMILSLSAAAKASLVGAGKRQTGDEIALALFGGKIPRALQQPTSTSVSTRGESARSGSTGLAETFAAKLAEAKAMPAADRFYAMNDESQAELMATSLPPAQQSQFLAAFKAKTLTIQDASDVPGLNYSQTTTASGSATGRGESVTDTYDSTLPSKLCPGGSFLWGTPILGCSLISWPSSSTTGADTSNGSITA